MRYSPELEFLRFSDNSSETHVTHRYRSFKWYIEYNSIFTTGFFKEDIKLDIFDKVDAFVISFENIEFLCEENTAIALSFKFNALIPRKKNRRLQNKNCSGIGYKSKIRLRFNYMQKAVSKIRKAESSLQFRESINALLTHARIFA